LEATLDTVAGRLVVKTGSRMWYRGAYRDLRDWNLIIVQLDGKPPYLADDGDTAVLVQEQ
jgi:hypothetical protein